MLPDAAEETGRPLPDKKELKAPASPTSARFWLGLVAFLFGLAVLATGLIFFSDWPGALAVEVIGAGLALLAICALVISGAWLPARPQPREAITADASHDLATLPVPTATSSKPEISPAPSASIESSSAPAVEEPIQPGASSAPAGQAVEEAPAPTEAPAVPDGEAVSAPDKRTTRPRKPAAQNGQPGAGAPRRRSAPLAGAPRGAPASGISGVTAPRLPALTNLPAGLPPSVDRNLIDPDANDLGELLGDIAEQTVMVMLTRGQRGMARRERMAAKIEAFRKEMALDPDYAAVTNFLESIIGLLRAGAIVPASRPLVDPFDGLYDYVLTLIRRKSDLQHD
jgi:hypothetical protein